MRASRERVEASERAATNPVVVISPHLDDAVFGCGQLLFMHPGSVVITALAGPPACYETITGWDAAAGFRPGDDVIATRRAEDRAALAILHARPIWLDFPDDQYGHAPSENILAAALDRAVAATGLTTIYLPLGLFHNDHKLTHAAMLRVLDRHPGFAWFGYEEPNYRLVANLRPERFRALLAAGIIATPAGGSFDAGREAKRAAVAEYRSQLRALASPGKPGTDDVFAPERYWRLSAEAAQASRARQRSAADGR
jgi:LmbE family N-acetylglucosaminyl deacetylase